MKQNIKKLDKSNHHDKIVGSLDSLTRKGLRLNSKRITLYISDWTTVIEHYLKA